VDIVQGQKNPSRRGCIESLVKWRSGGEGGRSEDKDWHKLRLAKKLSGIWFIRHVHNMGWLPRRALGAENCMVSWLCDAGRR
jgi:hypothetical protein